MRIEIVGKNGFVPTKAIENYVRKRLQKPISLFKPEWILSVRVVLKQYPGKYKVEVTMPCKGITLRSEVTDSDMYRAIDKTNDKLVAQVRKHKEKLTKHLAKKGIKDFYAQEFSDEPLELSKKEIVKKIVKRKEYELIPMTLEEAIIEMEMMGHDFYVFLNKETNEVNVCYLRKDGHYAVIETK